MSSSYEAPEVTEDSRLDSKRLANLVERAMQRAVRDAIAAHHRDGRPVAIWKDGQVVLWHPDGSYRPVSSELGKDDQRG